MITYLIIILICSTVVAIVNIITNPSQIGFYWYIIALIAYIILAVIIDGIVAFIIRKLPERWFDENKKIFTLSKKEKKLFECLVIKKWKGHVPDLGSFTGFSKGKIEQPKSNEYLKRFMLEASYGIMIHYVSFPTSYLLLLINYPNTSLFLTVGLPVAFVNSILILLPAMTLKYNLAKIKILYKRNERNKEINN